MYPLLRWSTLSGGSSGSWFTSLAGIISISSIIAAIFILVLFMMNRGRSETGFSYRDIWPRRSSSVRETALPAKEEYDARSSAHTDAAAVDKPPVVRGRPWSYGRQTILGQVPNISASAGTPGTIAPGRIMVKTPDAPDEDDIDYGEMIERELIQGVLSRSVYRDTVHELHKGASSELIPPEDRIISAMKLKRLMDNEEIDDDSLF